MFFILNRILVVGSNTRAVSKSLCELGFSVYATSFFDLVDMYDYVEKLIIVDSPTFNLGDLEEVALKYVDCVDYIMCCSDVDVSRFPKSKIIGNKSNVNIINKYKLYKHLHKNFLMPKTFKVNDTCEACEIVSNYPDSKFLVKPIIGSGGVGIRFFDDTTQIDSAFLLQEYISGDSISSSFLSYPDHTITMVTSSHQIIGSPSINYRNFMYCGNITPCINHPEKLENISSKISRMCKLVGSNGVDFVISDNRAYVIEVNPRIQGTFECVEKAYDMNMAKANIDACNGVDVSVNSVENFCVKLVVYSNKNTRYNLDGISYVYDISPKNYFFMKGEPVCSIVVADRILENAMSRAQHVQKLVYNSSY